MILIVQRLNKESSFFAGSVVPHSVSIFAQDWGEETFNMGRTSERKFPVPNTLVFVVAFLGIYNQSFLKRITPEKGFLFWIIKDPFGTDRRTVLSAFFALNIN